MRNVMRFATATVMFVTLGFLVNPASAGTIKLNGKYNVGSIEMKCSDNGGTFFNGPNGGYGCAGAGGGTVECNKKGSCTGTCGKCAARLGGQSGIVGVLPPRGGNAPPTDASGPKGKTGVGSVPVGGINQPQQGGPKGKVGLGDVPTAGVKTMGGGRDGNQPGTIQRGGGGDGGKH